MNFQLRKWISDTRASAGPLWQTAVLKGVCAKWEYVANQPGVPSLDSG